MGCVSDSLANGRCIKRLTVADDVSYECVDIAVDYMAYRDSTSRAFWIKPHSSCSRMPPAIYA